MEFRDEYDDVLEVISLTNDRESPELRLRTQQCAAVLFDRARVARLRDALSRWLKTGSVEERTGE